MQKLLISAVKKGDIALILSLIEQGIDRNANNGEVFLLACKLSDMQAVRTMFSNQLSQAITSEACAIAISEKNTTLLRFLLTHNANAYMLCNVDLNLMYNQNTGDMLIEINKLIKGIDDKYLLLLLDSYFLYSKVSPLTYIIKCPTEWHRLAAMTFYKI
jgi:hypothetical protein